MKTYVSSCGKTVYFNDFDEPVLLYAISKEEMRILISDFRAIQLEWAVDLLCQPSERLGSIGQPMTMGLVGGIRTSNGASWHALRMKTSKFAATAWSVSHTVGTKASDRAKNIPLMSYENQVACIRTAAGDTIQSLDFIINQDRRHEFTHLVIESDLDASSTTNDFICMLYKRLRNEAQPLWYHKKHPIGADGISRRLLSKSEIISCFFLWLVEHGVVLLPLLPRVFSPNPRGLEIAMLQDRSRGLLRSCLEAYATTYGKKGGVSLSMVGSIEETWVTSIRQAYFSLIVCCNMRDREEYSADLFATVAERLYDARANHSHSRPMRQLSR